MLDHPSDHAPLTLADELSLLSEQSDSLEDLCHQAIKALPAEAAAIKKGNLNVLNKLVGMVMKSSRGTANATAAKATLQQILRA